MNLEKKFQEQNNPQKGLYLLDSLGSNSYRDMCILLDTAVADFAGTMESTAAVVVWRMSPALMAETDRPGMHTKCSHYQFVKVITYNSDNSFERKY